MQITDFQERTNRNVLNVPQAPSFMAESLNKLCIAFNAQNVQTLTVPRGCFRWRAASDSKDEKIICKKADTIFHFIMRQLENPQSLSRDSLKYEAFVRNLIALAFMNPDQGGGECLFAMDGDDKYFWQIGNTSYSNIFQNCMSQGLMPPMKPRNFFAAPLPSFPQADTFTRNAHSSSNKDIVDLTNEEIIDLTHEDDSDMRDEGSYITNEPEIPSSTSNKSTNLSSEAQAEILNDWLVPENADVNDDSGFYMTDPVFRDPVTAMSFPSDNSANLSLNVRDNTLQQGHTSQDNNLMDLLEEQGEESFNFTQYGDDTYEMEI